MDRTKVDIPPLLEERDREYIEKAADPKLREAIICSVTTHRRPDRLKVGDPGPAIALPTLDGSREVMLGGPRVRPLVLIFGSYT